MQSVLPLLNESQVNDLFPFYILIDSDLKIKDQGKGMSKITGLIKGEPLIDHFKLIRPDLNQFTFSDLSDYIGQLVILGLKNHAAIKIRGQFIIPGDNKGKLLFVGSVWLNDINDLQATGLTLSDFALHDPLIDMLQMVKNQEIVTSDISQLVSKLRDQKNQIELRERKYRDMLDNLYDGVVIFSAKGQILECNKALSDMTGYSEEELMTMTGKDITHPDDWQKAAFYTDKLIRHGFVSSFTLRMVTKLGKITDIEISSNAIFQNGIYKGARDIIRDITDRKRSEERLKELSLVSEETSNLVIITNARKEIEWVNKSFTRLTGYTLAEVIGKLPGAVLQGAGTNQQTVKEISEALKNKENFSGTILNYTKEGVPYWNELTINPIKDITGNVQKYIAISSDLTDHIKKNEQLLYSELRWKFAIEESGDGYFEYDIPNQKFMGSSNLLSLIGIDDASPELDFNTFLNIIKPDSDIAVNALLNLISGKSDTFRHETRFKKKTGEYVWVIIRATISNRSAEGVPRTLLGTTTDITHIKTTENALYKAKTEAEKASEYKNQFLATMSHEIRTPLNAIIGLTDIMLMKKPKGELKENLNILSFSAFHLLSLINDVLDLSKIESGKIDFVNSEFDFEEIIKGVYQTFVPKCNEKNLSISYTIDKNIPKKLKGDSLRLIQILNNLINNAVKFTPKGSVSIHVHAAKPSNTNNLKLTFEIKDTGIGINKSAQEKIFDDFYQADSSITQRFGGTGLGLAITRQLITLQGGHIKVESEPDKGSTFSFDISFDLAGPGSDHQKKANEDGSSKKSLANIKILLVEDILVNQKVAVSYLNHWNAEVVCANNGLEGLKLFHKQKFDLILMDLYMPVLNGFDTIKRIRGTEKGKNIPIIALTASAETNTIKKALDQGANAWVGKPFNATQLLDTIRGQLSNKIEQTVIALPEPKVKAPKKTFKYINLQKIEDASLGKREFVMEMVNLLRSEIPEVMTECKEYLAAKRYFDFSRSVHKLKNSLLMIGFDKLKKDLSYLQDMAEQEKELESIEKIFAKVLTTWEAGEKELMSV